MAGIFPATHVNIAMTRTKISYQPPRGSECHPRSPSVHKETTFKITLANRILWIGKLMIRPQHTRQCQGSFQLVDLGCTLAWVVILPVTYLFLITHIVACIRTVRFSIDLQCIYDILLLTPVPIPNKRHIVAAHHLSSMLSYSHLSLFSSPLSHFLPSKRQDSSN